MPAQLEIPFEQMGGAACGDLAAGGRCPQPHRQRCGWIAGIAAGRDPQPVCPCAFCYWQARKLVVPAAAVLPFGSDSHCTLSMPKVCRNCAQVRLGDETAGAAGIEVLAGLKPGENVALDPVRAGLAVK